MPTPDWRQKNSHKSRQYSAKYIENNTVVTVILKLWVVEEVDKIKDSSQPYGALVRKQGEAWAEKQRLNAESSLEVIANISAKK